MVVREECVNMDLAEQVNAVAIESVNGYLPGSDPNYVSNAVMTR